MSENTVAQLFEAGVSDYWRGWVPENWNNPDHRLVCAYCTGWYFESLADLGLLDTDEECSP